MNTFSKIVAGALLAAVSITTSYAQTNLGSECGCPPLSSRTVVTMSSLGVNANGELLANQTLTCDKLYKLDQKIYVPSGKTLTIKPGVCVKGLSQAVPANAVALIVERGGKIMADGTKDCNIVFTSDADPMDGSYPMTNVGEWGGIVLLGIATNNLTTANVYTGGYNGVGFIEGFSAANARDLYGAGDPLFPTNDDNDNSGILRYVSIRHAGAILAIGNELNGLSLGSVGRGTTIEHVETIAAADDNIEFFGGTVDVKYCSVLFGDDDFYDFDLNYKGRGQFLFGMAGDSITGLHTTDNGFECDADDDKKSPDLRSHPFFYNCTLISNGHVKPSADNTGPAAIQAKELTEGEFYNCIFANFRSGLHLAKARSNSTNKGDAYDNWTDNTSDPYLTTASPAGVARYHSLIVKNNTFIGFPTVAPNLNRFIVTVGTMVTGKNPPTAWVITDAPAADLTQFYNDGNTAVDNVNGIDYNWSWNDAGHTSYSNNPFHVTPVTNITSTIAPPADGFFNVVNYRGAFDATKTSWLSDWAFAQVPTQAQSNPTDLNNDGVTDIIDFNIFVGKFGQPDSK